MDFVHYNDFYESALLASNTIISSILLQRLLTYLDSNWIESSFIASFGEGNTDLIGSSILFAQQMFEFPMILLIMEDDWLESAKRIGKPVPLSKRIFEREEECKYNVPIEKCKKSDLFGKNLLDFLTPKSTPSKENIESVEYSLQWSGQKLSLNLNIEWILKDEHPVPNFLDSTAGLGVSKRNSSIMPMINFL